MSIQHITSVDYCSMKIGSSSQGVLYSPEVEGTLPFYADTTRNFEAAMRVQIKEELRRAPRQIQDADDEAIIKEWNNRQTETRNKLQVPQKQQVTQRRETGTTPGPILPGRQQVMIDRRLIEEDILAEKEAPLTTLSPPPTPRQHTLMDSRPSKEAGNLPISEFEMEQRRSGNETEEEDMENQPRPQSPTLIVTPPNGPNLTHLPIQEEEPEKIEYSRIRKEKGQKPPPSAKVEESTEMDDDYLMETLRKWRDENRQISKQTPKRESHSKQVRQDQRKGVDSGLLAETVMTGTEDDVYRKLTSQKQGQREPKGTLVDTAPIQNAKLQYVFDILRLNVTYMVSQIVHQICVDQRMTLDMAHYLTENKHPNVIARVLLKDHRFTAELAGDAIRLKPRTKINSYFFI